MSQLEFDLAECDDDMVRRMATESVECGEYNNWDHAYEALWAWLEDELITLAG